MSDSMYAGVGKRKSSVARVYLRPGKGEVRINGREVAEYFPRERLRTAMYAKNLDIWCAPTVDDRDIWQTSMIHIAYEGRNFLVSACQYQPPPSKGSARDKTWPEGKPLIRGGSVIISPMGEVLAGPLYNDNGLIWASIDLDDIIKARYDMDPVGHYSRPDIFKLSVDEQERPAVSSAKPA